MSKIIRLSRILKWFFLLNVVLVPVPSLIMFSNLIQTHGKGLHFALTINTVPITYAMFTALNPGAFAFACFLMILPMLLFMLLSYTLYLLFSCYAQGEIFSQKTTAYFTRIGLLLLLHEAADFITAPILIYILSSYRAIDIGLTSSQLSNVVIALILLIIAKIMQEGHRLKNEAALTI